ncbi:ATPase [Rhodobacter sp. NTK016B]|uniref:ATP12 family chaperone protein n=1 Tax=Rhodobacter sp. NTK016B TaxID=2759676 RepID=UPI001A8EB6B4|nr:ATP12 family protein [Rhodobacter sp. NTK016B]MBN8294686.1 ATPase [Rhodobacter sp. NTK016B]
MSDWAPKKFWTEATVAELPEGFTVRLDGRPVKTPAKAPLVIPTREMAELVAAEWHAQEDKIVPDTMPATRAANAAIDKVRGQFAEVAGIITAYGETDLLCYRADSPAELVARQRVAWDPLLEWSAGRYGVRWNVTTGVMPTPQPPETLDVLRRHVEGYTPFQLTAFHDLVAMSGSMVIGLAAAERIASVDALWAASRIDEDWQIEQWGEDEEAQRLTLARRHAFSNAARFFAASTL